jgi:hypothetical protein
MTKSYVPFLLLLTSVASGFLCKPGPMQRIHASRPAYGGGSSLAVQTRLFMSNETFEADAAEMVSDGPLANAKEMWESFSTTSAYRTTLFTGALLSSAKIRDILGLPVCVGIFVLTWALYTYETKFNELCDRVAPKRKLALQNLRQAKTQQLSSSETTAEDIRLLAARYEEVLRDELATRVIIPGLWVIEMDPDVEDRAAAPLFLGLEITDKYTLEPVEKD